ncbi:hypothetical protein [Agaribacterium haliotis]|uniref:hypothetical protein n=1 Tax=Agaribacterium haliotis TaxID=2013869 RepID=UPI000BB54F89|nr:hypothetical protein [Agaribacterium haliotis]
MQASSGKSFQASKPYLVFSSVGDQALIESWCKGKGRDSFDLAVFYYGDSEPEYLAAADYVQKRKGSKFQNLKAFYSANSAVLANYDAVLVLDDDIEIDADRIAYLFELRKKLELWLIQPSFSYDGKISFEHTQQNPKYRYRFTNFVEMNCPLFVEHKLADFMSIYDGSLPGWGMDWWYHNVIGGAEQNKIAIVDEVAVRNPFDQEKRGGQREINKLVGTKDRKKLWRQCMEKNGYEEFEPEVFGGEKRKFDLFRLCYGFIALSRFIKRKRIKGF